MQNELVSIITPMYNASRFVAQTIESVLAQTYPYWEMLIVNDGSKDNCAEIVEEYVKKDSRIKLIHQVNAGSATARNNALRNASGKYICFLDSDDLWNPNMLKEQVNFLKEKNATLVFASYNRIDMNGNKLIRPFIVPERVTYQKLLCSCSISCLTALYDKEKAGEQYFLEELGSMRDDFVFWLEMIKKVKYAYGNKNILASYRILSTSVTSNKQKVIIPQFNVYFKIEKLGLMRSLYYLTNWAIIGFFLYF
jgi:glycosyltransferase involved in cell wall biosynthesis